jgi:hypothetical protein
MLTARHGFVMSSVAFSAVVHCLLGRFPASPPAPIVHFALLQIAIIAKCKIALCAYIFNLLIYKHFIYILRLA